MATTRIDSVVVRLRRMLPRLITFLGGQLGVQTLTFVAGFLSLRWLSVDQYAKFGLAFAFQSVASLMVDSGFSNTIIALVGERRHDPAIVGSYLHSARHYRNRLYVFAIPLAAILFFLLGRRHSWASADLLIIFGGIAVTIWFQGSLMLQSVLIMHGRLRAIYTTQFAAAGTRIFLLCFLHTTGLLGAISAVWIGAAAYGATIMLLRIYARSLIVTPRTVSREHNQQCLQLALPQTPSIVFYAFQGQITMAIISALGATRNIAEIAALGRLGQVFTLFAMFNGIFVEPIIARTAKEQLPARYTGMLVGSALVATSMIVFSSKWPEPLLWVLGPHYANMQNEVVILVSAAAIGYVAHAVWIMNLARKFLAWWYTGLQVFAVVGLQCAAAPFLRLSTTRGVLILSVVAASANLFAHLIGGMSGLMEINRGLRSITSAALGSLPDPET